MRAVVHDISNAVPKIIELLRASKRPLLHIGQGVRLAGAELELAQFLSLTGIPVLTARNANDMIASDHPQFIGRPGTFAQRGANFAVQTCDFYLAIGTRLCLAQTGYNAKDYARNALIVIVDIDRAELENSATNRPLTVCADARDIIGAMNEKLNADIVRREFVPDWSPWLARCKAWQAEYPPVTPKQWEGDKVNSYAFADALSDAASADDVIVTDMGFAFQTMHQAFHVKQGQRFYTNGGLAAMGWGLPAAIGAHYATGRRVLCVAGDGGLMMNVQELSVLQHARIPVKLFILNNGGYLTMRQSQENAFDGYMGSDVGSGIAFPSFGLLAEAHGIPFLRCENHESMRRIIGEVLEAPGPMICELVCDPNQEAVKSVNRRDAAGNLVQTAIEDAFPYLDRAEVERNLRIDQ